jgi:hypothetical protein
VKGEGRREKGRVKGREEGGGRREKGEGRREKGGGRRHKHKESRKRCVMLHFCGYGLQVSEKDWTTRGEKMQVRKVATCWNIVKKGERGRE